MRLFRVISQKEKEALLNDCNTLKQHKTCKVPHWILFQHPEDYETGKYFFFELLDALKYAREIYGFHKNCSLLEIDIDESIVFPYLGFGVYCYADYDSCGMWNNNLSHRIPEVLLPYAIVESKTKSNCYNLTDLDCKAYSISGALYNKHRNPEFLNLGDLVSELCFAKKAVEDTSPENKGSWYGEYEIKRHKEKQDEVNQLLLLLPNVYQKFVDSHKNYNAQLSNYIEPNEPSTENFSK